MRDVILANWGDSKEGMLRTGLREEGTIKGVIGPP